MSREKQIEEMANAMCNLGEVNCQECAEHWDFVTIPKCDLVKRAEQLYNAGYRKQSEGEWLGVWDYECSVCHEYHDIKTKYCPNCGAKMTKGDVD